MIQNTAKRRGRPRSFDETGALEKATQVFWSKGYDGVIIDDLVAGMGVGRPQPVCRLWGQAGDILACPLRRTRREKALAPPRRSTLRALFVTHSPPS